MNSGVTYDSTKALTSSTDGYGCASCIRNRWTYAVPDSQTWHSLINSGDYAGECCDTIENCPNAYDSTTSDKVKTGWKASTVTFSTPEMAVHACPMKASVCKMAAGWDNYATDISTAGGNIVGLSASSSWTTKDSCTYIFGTRPTTNALGDTYYNEYAKKQMPQVLSYDANNAGADEVMIHYLEWQTTQITSDSVYTAWPKSDSTVAVINDQSAYLRNTFVDFWYQEPRFLSNNTYEGKSIWGCETPYDGPNPISLNTIMATES